MELFPGVGLTEILDTWTPEILDGLVEEKLKRNKRGNGGVEKTSLIQAIVKHKKKAES